MTEPTRNTWKDIHEEVLQRIRSRVWRPGDLIPNEVELAKEFGCARATVNRALRAAADAGLLERRRKAGTRVAANPAHKAVLRIPVLRQEIEERGAHYSYQLQSKRQSKPPSKIRLAMKLDNDQVALRVRALHFANKKPFILEDRWINVATVRPAATADFETDNANEWLLANAPFTHGEVNFSAINATKQHAKLLGVPIDKALFAVQRSTWLEAESITYVELTYAPDHIVTMTI